MNVIGTIFICLLLAFLVFGWLRLLLNVALHGIRFHRAGGGRDAR